MSELIELSPEERHDLNRLLTHHTDSRQFQRALALILLDDGESASEVGEQLHVRCRTIYRWVNWFEQRCGLPPAERLMDAPRSGRPATVQGVIDDLIDAVIDGDPRVLGYNSTVWTASLLRQYLHDRHQLEVSIRSIGLALARLRIRWKLPRHVLARRDPFWRQAKGGSNAAFGRTSEPSSSCSTRRSSRRPRPCMRRMAESVNR